MEVKGRIAISPASNQMLAAFCDQMSVLLCSGISVNESLELILGDSNQEDRPFLEALLDGYNSTGSLAEALGCTDCSPYLRNMTALGEETGNLDKVMESLGRHYAREESIRQSIRSAVLYPAILIGMMLAVVLVLLTEVMPIFSQVFLQLGTEMTGFSKGLLDLGNLISNYSLALVILLVLLMGMTLYAGFTNRGAELRSKLSNRLPLVRKIRDLTCACRLADTLSMTLRSGLDPQHALDLAGGLIEDTHFLKKLDHCREELAQGADLHQALLAAGIYSGVHSQMISIGSKTGTLDTMMKKVAADCQEKVDTRISGLIAILEPSLVAALSIVVGIILLSVMLPLLGIMSGI